MLNAVEFYFGHEAKQESLPGSIGALNFIYKTTARRFCLKFICGRRFISLIVSLV